MSLGFVRTFVVVAVVATAAPLAAQTAGTRAEEIAKAQAEKASRVHEYRRLWIERKLLEIEEAGGFTVAQGFFITAGDIKSGSGFALGPAYTKLFDNEAIISVKGAYSIRSFKVAQLFAQAPPLDNGRLIVNGRVRWQDAPELAVYQLGPASPKIRADYAETKTEVSGQAHWRLPVVVLGAGAAFERFETGPADSNRGSVAQIFGPLSMPGIDADPEYLHTFVTAGIDTTEGPGYTRRGSVLRGTLHDYRDRSDGPFSFQRVDGIARQLIPILRGNQVFDLSLRVSTTTADGGNEVPFFLMPDLGGGSDLRGFGNYRFRDRHSLLFTAEYRWYVQEFVDMALFYDAGKVTPRRGDLDFDNLKSDFGIGIRFHGPQTTVLRIEVAKSNEGLRFIFGFSPSVR